jgi:Recombination endonuclease VII
MKTAKPCKEAGTDANHLKRPAPYPGPRCYTCWGVKEAQRKNNAHRAYVAKTYGVDKTFYDMLYEFQGGRCALCRRATGASKRLANDHDHKCCPGPVICGKCLRGLLCGPCNETIGRWSDDPEIFLRGFRYLTCPPARQLRNKLETAGS